MLLHLHTSSSSMATVVSCILPLLPASTTRRKAAAFLVPRNVRYCRQIVSSSNWCSYRRQVSWKVSRKVVSSQVELESSLDDDEACELVNGVELVLRDQGQDTVHAYLMKAVKNNNGTGLLLLSDIFGFQDSSTRDFAYRIACNGYNVLLPDLFRGNPWKNGQSEHEYKQWLSKQQPERIAKDIATSIKWLTDEFTAAGISKKFGIIGFSFGGKHLIETLAQDEEAHFGTGICFYGIDMDPSLGNNIKVPVLFVAGDNDPLCPVSILQKLEKNIQGSKVMIYHGREHRFVDRPESQEDDLAADDAFTASRNWLYNALLASKT